LLIFGSDLFFVEGLEMGDGFETTNEISFWAQRNFGD
jgi:hypothetical protein